MKKNYCGDEKAKLLDSINHWFYCCVSAGGDDESIPGLHFI
jgi:hypothetical protein